MPPPISPLPGEIMRDGHTSLLFASHALPEVELRHRVAVIDAGRLRSEAISVLNRPLLFAETFFRLTGR
jgi:hypothetical protein